MEIDRKQFKEILETVKYGLAGKDESLEGSTSFYFEGDKVHTFNDSVSVSCEVPDLDFTGEVHAAELLGFVSKTGAKVIKIGIDENLLVLTSGKAKAGLALKEDSTLPIDSIGKIGKWKELPEEVVSAMSFVRHACGTDFTRPIITCVNVTNEFVEGTDGFRIAHVTLEEDQQLPVDDFLIPAAAVPHVSTVKPTHIYLGESWVHFKNESGAILSCRIFEDENFPNTKPVLNNEGKDIVFPDNVLDILSRASIFSESSSGTALPVTVSIAKKKVTISSKSDTGWFEEFSKITYDGDEINFDVSIALLQDVLKETKDAYYTEKFLSFMFGNTEYVTMLR